jgi:hypothetical protein
MSKTTPRQWINREVLNPRWRSHQRIILSRVFFYQLRNWLTKKLNPWCFWHQQVFYIYISIPIDSRRLYTRGRLRIRMIPPIFNKIINTILSCLMEIGKVAWWKNGARKTRDTVPLNRLALGRLERIARGHEEHYLLILTITMSCKKNSSRVWSICVRYCPFE